MRTHFIECTNGPQNWGKFMLGVFENVEWAARSEVAPGLALVSSRGWTDNHVFVLDLQTGEGAVFKPGGYAKADLNKHKIWVCPLYEPFLTWLYEQPRDKIFAFDLPRHVDLPDAPSAAAGYRRPGRHPFKPDLKSPFPKETCEVCGTDPHNGIHEEGIHV